MAVVGVVMSDDDAVEVGDLIGRSCSRMPGHNRKQALAAASIRSTTLSAGARLVGCTHPSHSDPRIMTKCRNRES